MIVLYPLSALAGFYLWRIGYGKQIKGETDRAGGRCGMKLGLAAGWRMGMCPTDSHLPIAYDCFQSGEGLCEDESCCPDMRLWICKKE